MWLTESLNQVNHIEENLTHHLRTLLQLQTQRLHTPCLYGLTRQMMKMLQIEAKSSNIFGRNGQPRSETQEKLLLQKLPKPTRMMMVKLTKVTANGPNQSLNVPLAVPKRRTHHQRSNLLMTTWMSTLVQVRAKTVKELQMSHPLKLQRSRREQNQKMILKLPVAEGFTNHLIESEDSSSSSSSRSDSESSDEEKVPSKEKKELPPPPPKKKHRS